MGDYLQELSASTGLPAYKKKGPFTQLGSVIGTRNGYLSAMGPANENNQNSVNFFVRFKNGSDKTAIIQALSTSETFLQALEEKKWKKSLEQSLIVGDDYLQFDWKFSLRRPAAEKVAAVHTAIIEAIRNVAAPAEARCDLCDKTSVSKPSLYNGIPGYYCGSCQSQAQTDQNAAAAEYAARETNLARGLMFGILAAVVGAIAWGGVAYAINYIFLYGAVLIGFLIAKAVFYGIGKINTVGQIAVFVLTVASVFFGDAIFYTLSIMKSEGIPFSTELLGNVVTHMVEIETSDSQGFFTTLFALVGAGIVVYSNRKPKFVATFEELDGESVQHQVAFAGK